MADSTYTPLPSDEKHAPLSSSTAPLATNEKPSLHRNSTEDALLRPSATTAQQQAGTTRKAALKAALLTTAVLALGGAGTVGLFCSPDDAGTAWRELKTSVRQGCGFAGQEEGQAERLVKRGRGEWAWWKRDGGGEGEGQTGVEEFSTSTFKDGRTSTFVKTTRPIVNPGGFTIGTLTGYVPTLINGTTVGGPTPTSSPTSSPVSSPSATSSPSSGVSSSASDTSSSDGESFTRETSSLPPSFAASVSVSSTDWYAAPASPSGEGEEETVSVTETTTITAPTSTATTTVTQTETITAAPSSSSSAAGARLVKRSEAADDEEEAAEEQEEEETATGKEEFSTSVNRKGDVTYTLVKTTRPIVNAGGYTIGTLDGAWVDVAKQTDRPKPSSDLSSASSATPTPAPTAAPDAEKRAQHQHEELRKRDEEGA